MRAGMVKRKAVSGEWNNDPYMIMPAENASMIISAAKNIANMPWTISSCVSGCGMAVCKNPKPLRNMTRRPHHNNKLRATTKVARKRACRRICASCVLPIRQRTSQKAFASSSAERNSVAVGLG